MNSKTIINKFCIFCGTSNEKADYITSTSDDRYNIQGLFDVVKCKSCSHIYTKFEDSFSIKKLYESNYSAHDPSKIYYKLRNYFYRSFLFIIYLKVDGDQYFLPLLNDNKKLTLDFGCYEGRQMYLFSKLGIPTEGYEINETALQITKKMGFIVHNEDINIFVNNNLQRFHIVQFSNVIEHLENPLNTLILLRRTLKNEGLIKIAIPNFDSIFRKIFKNNWANYHLPFHFHHFNQRQIFRLIESAGFAVTKFKTISPSLGLTYSLLNFLKIKNKYNIIITPTVLLIIFLLKPIIFFLNIFGKGDTMLVQAKKINE